MPDFSLEDLAAPVATASPNFGVKVAAGALVFGCGLYRDYPGAILGQNPGAFARGLMDTLCDDRPPGLPPPPSSPFTGGQCPGQNYNVYVSGFFTNGGTVANNNVVLAGRIIGTYVDAAGTGAINHLGVKAQAYGGGSVRDLRITSVTTQFGAPDPCGNLPAEYPSTPIPPERRQGNVTNVYNDGDSFTVPLVYTPVSFSAPFTINAGGVNFKFDFGGVTIGDGDQGITNIINNVAGNVTKISSDTDVIRNDTNIIRNDTDVINNTVNRTEGDVTNLGNTINVVNTFITNAPIPPEQITEDPPSEDPEKEAVSNLFAVRLRLTQIPVNSKQQFGVGAPNVLYAGWFEFKRGEFCFPRDPIAFQDGIFRAPIGADGYAYTLYVGYRGEATVIKLDTVSEVEA